MFYKNSDIEAEAHRCSSHWRSPPVHHEQEQNSDVLGGKHRFMEPDVLPIQQTVKEFHRTQSLCYITVITAVNTPGAAEKPPLNAILFAALVPETWPWQVSPQPWTSENAALQLDGLGLKECW